mmetsp:Transcript_1578/g.2529  ORF Transcript_1578/g.2529 Transcript_1578/m.2529 type:complete len:856 (+) Transcript_1578:141-2708(+)
MTIELATASIKYDSLLEKFSNAEILFDQMVFDAESVDLNSQAGVPSNIFTSLSLISDNLHVYQKSADKMSTDFEVYSKKIELDMQNFDSVPNKYVSSAYKSLRELQTRLCAAYEKYFDINKRIHSVSGDDYRKKFGEFEDSMELLNNSCDVIQNNLAKGRTVLDDAAKNIVTKNTTITNRLMMEWRELDARLESNILSLQNGLHECGQILEYCKNAGRFSAQPLEPIIKLVDSLKEEEEQLNKALIKSKERMQKLKAKLRDRSQRDGKYVKSSGSIPSSSWSLVSGMKSQSSQEDISSFSYTSMSNDSSSYYIGKEGGSKMKVWRERESIVDDVMTPDLPEGWRQIVDKRSCKPFYVNQHTKEKQWKRPSSVRTALTTSSTLTTKSRDFTSSSKGLSRQSRTASMSDAVSGLSGDITIGGTVREHSSNPIFKYPRTLQSAMSSWNSTYQADKDLDAQSKESKNSKISRRIEKARKGALRTLAQVEELAASDSGHQGCVSVAYFDKIGIQDKCGYLMKQTKLLRRWRKRFVVLRGSTLTYFDSEEEYNRGGPAAPGKSLELSETVSVAYTSVANCFCISKPAAEANTAASTAITNSTGSNKAADWFFLADNERDLEAWITAINAHMHIQYKLDRNITGDYWDEKSSLVYTSFWRMPVPSQPSSAADSVALKRPLGIRSVPAVDGPRTGEGVFPGEVVEVVQAIPDLTTNQVYLRLAYDRGWAIARHPTSKNAVLCEVRGDYVEEKVQYRFVARSSSSRGDEDDDLSIYRSPNCGESAEIGRCYESGSVISTCAKWTPCEEGDEEIVEERDGEAEGDQRRIRAKSNVYLKLADSEGVDGWVAVFHPVTGEELLTRAS